MISCITPKLLPAALLVVAGPLLLAPLEVSAWSGNNSNGGVAGAFTRIGYGARALALGNAVIARTGSSQFLLENPVAMSGLTGPEFNATWHNLSLDRRLYGITAVLPLQPAGALGVQILQSGVDDIPEINLDGRETGTNLRYRETVYTLAFALTPSAVFGFGGSLNIYTANFPQVGIDAADLSEASMGINLGIHLQPLPQLSLGASLRNLNAGYQWNSTTVWDNDGDASVDDAFPLLYGIGAAWRFYLDEILLTTDYIVSDRGAWDVNYGVEWTKPLPRARFFHLRGGQMADDWTAGFGLQLQVMERPLALDYAIRFAANDPAEVHVITWSFGL